MRTVRPLFETGTGFELRRHVMSTSTSLRWLVVAVSGAMLLAFAAACGAETVEVPGETVVVEKEVVKPLRSLARPSSKRLSKRCRSPVRPSW